MFWMYRDVDDKVAPGVDIVAPLTVIDLSSDDCKIVLLLTVRISWALLVDETTQPPTVWPEGQAENIKPVKVELHVEHWVGSSLTLQVPQVEWHNRVTTQLLPL